MFNSLPVLTNRRRRPPAGFTLIEVMIVMSMLGALAGMLFPPVQPPREAEAQPVTPARYVAANVRAPACSCFNIVTPAPFTAASAFRFDEQWSTV
jgi:prepilin-type N-terminal cleavage/methylation domain-containing protein